jgi:hypothetical protein
MLRDYQQRTIDQLYAWFQAGNDPFVAELRQDFDGRIVG